MYEYFFGSVVEKSPTSLVLDVNGVGHRFHVPISTSMGCPSKGDVKILAFLYIREEEMRLYGFLTKEERDLFVLLLTVKGVGPQVALGILSSMAIEKFLQGVLQEDALLISSIRGIGKKLAQRIILELKEPLAKLGIETSGLLPVRDDSVAEDASKALISLGYKKKPAEEAILRVRKKFPEIEAVEELVRKALSSNR